MLNRAVKFPHDITPINVFKSAFNRVIVFINCLFIWETQIFNFSITVDPNKLTYYLGSVHGERNSEWKSRCSVRHKK